MDTVLRSVLPFLGILVALVVVHELGHYFTAKAAGIKVLEFGIGYPPKLWGKRFGETEYTINALPLGGFVRMLGEEDPSDPESFAAKPRWVRVIVLLSGAAMNAILPVFLFTCTFLIPQDVAVGRAVVDRVEPGTPAADAGVRSGDIIQRINGREIGSLADAHYVIRLNQGSTMTWTIQRPIEGISGPVSAGRETMELQVYGRWAPPSGQGPTGIALQQRGLQIEKRSYPIWEAVPKAFVRTAESLILARNQIISWVVGRTAPQVAGPVGIAQATGEVVKQAGWVALFEFSALLSINLAIVNVLPLPMLDGGRVLFIVIEMLRGGKRIPPERESLVHLAGFVVLIGLMVLVTFADIQRLVAGESPFR
ncbi:MAG: M50 family metallopeptidase [Dehalococcoidia bacterium]